MSQDRISPRFADVFKEADRDLNGRLIEVHQLGVLFPNMASHLMMQFGGEILKVVDEVSASLCSLYAARQAVHVGEEIFFRQAIMVGETTRMIFRVAHTTQKIIVVHSQVFGGEFNLDQFTLRYEGFSLCGIIGADGKLAEVPKLALSPNKEYDQIAKIAEEVVNHQRGLLKKLDEWRR